MVEYSWTMQYFFTPPSKKRNPYFCKCSDSSIYRITYKILSAGTYIMCIFHLTFRNLFRKNTLKKLWRSLYSSFFFFLKKTPSDIQNIQVSFLWLNTENSSIAVFQNTYVFYIHYVSNKVCPVKSHNAFRMYTGFEMSTFILKT